LAASGQGCSIEAEQSGGPEQPGERVAAIEHALSPSGETAS